MYAGEIVERAAVDELFSSPQHPYTVGLLGSIPRLDHRAEQLATIEGMVPNMAQPPHSSAAAPWKKATAPDAMSQPSRLPHVPGAIGIMPIPNPVEKKVETGRSFHARRMSALDISRRAA